MDPHHGLHPQEAVTSYFVKSVCVAAVENLSVCVRKDGEKENEEW